MPTEVSAEAYQDIRDHIESTWTHISILDGAQAELFRLPIADSRVSWSHTPGAQTLEMTVELSGADTELDPLPTTVGGSALYNVATNGDILHTDTADPFTFNSTEDSLTIRHRVQVPQVA